jgi:hypothetical protein
MPPPITPTLTVATNTTAPPATGRLPKLSFPRFDGDNPRHWLSLCFDYFEMYNVLSSVWIRVAKQHLDNAVARWLQSIEPELDFSNLQNFSCLLHDHFDSNQKEDPMFYTMCFIDGLRADIKAIVLVLRPKDLDSACTIALLQESVSGGLPR